MSIRAIAMGMGIVALAGGTANAGVMFGSSTVDFEGFGAGTVMSNQIPGMTISAINNNGPDIAMIFDSSNWTGGDNDLQTPGYHPTNNQSLGKILIISEDGDSSDPDDEADGGRLYFDLDFVAERLTGIIVDIESSETYQVKLYRNGSEVFSTGFVNGLGDNSLNPFDTGDIAGGFDKVRIKLSGSGAVGGLNFVPTPGTLALLAGAGFLGARRRR
ncbi:MAG: hypothetical protein R3B46_02330 [Phycisphaerales bacterium]